MKKFRPILSILLLLFFCVGFFFAPNDPFKVDTMARFGNANEQYPLGTDILGRCIVSRLLYGGTATVGIVVLGGVVVSFLGIVIGLFIAREKSKHHIIFDSFLNAITAIPPIAYLIIFIAAWGNGIFTMLVAITLSLFLKMIKIVKTRAEVELQKAYIMCAYTSGASRHSILFFHILPNLLADVVRYICLSSADMILAIVGFSFIGLGLGDNVIDWGTMISDSHHVILSYPQMTVLPVVCIFLATFSFILLGRCVEKGKLYD